VSLESVKPFSPRGEPAPADTTTPSAEPQAAAFHAPIDIRNAALTIIAGLALVVGLQYAQVMIIPIVLGVLISYALGPLVQRLERMHVPRPIGAALVLLTVVATTGVLLYQLRNQAQAIVDQLPDAARRVRHTLQATTNRQGSASAIEQVQKAATELERAADNAGTAPAARAGVARVQVESAPINVSQYLMYGSLGVAAAIGQFVLILFLAYFLLASGDLYRRKLIKIVGPSLTQKKITLQILDEIDRQIEYFLLVQLFSSTVVGAVSWAGFYALGLQQPGVWGLLAGIFNSIPYFGPVVVTGTIAVVAFMQFGTIQMTAAVAGVALAITSLEGYLLTPWLTSRAARMNAVAVFIGLLFWGWVWSVWGMLLAVPLLMVIKAICDHVEDFKGVGELLGD
jgi:predicted PurR-regulated permease PerM